MLPEDLDDERDAATPPFAWLAKDPHHRGVVVLEHPPDAGAWRAQLHDGVVFQRRVERPWLIDGRVCDVGVYALVDGNAPVRLFDDVLLRCAAAPYPDALHRIDAGEHGSRVSPDVVNRAVVIQEDYHDAGMLPSLVGEHGRTRSTLRALRALLGAEAQPWAAGVARAIASALADARDMGAPGDAVPRAACGWRKALPTVLWPLAWPCGVQAQTFEHLRFDFVFDASLHPRIVEVNASPNIKARNDLQAELLDRQLRGLVSRAILRQTDDMRGADGWFEIDAWKDL